jgi:anti-sigma regulatory factor (Ser/Thr protein kinase)
VSGLRHDAFMYANERDYVAGVVPFILAGCEADQPVLVAVPSPNLDGLRGHLDSDDDGVAFVDMVMLGRNPGRIIPAVQEFLDEHPGQRTRFVGEPIWAGRTQAELDEATRHEALINLAFANASADILCPYDTGRLRPEVLADAERTHPTIANCSGQRSSDSYADPHQFSAEGWTLPPPGRNVTELSFSGLGSVRQVAVDAAGRASLDPERIDDLLLAVNEICTNTLVHGSGHGVLRLWTDPENLFCEVQDEGTITDPLVGRHCVDFDAEAGRGLFLVNQMCDLVQLRSGPSGTTVRVTISRV